jgi:signal transduction histidine kinase
MGGTSTRTLDYLTAVALAVAALAVRWSIQPWVGPLQPFAPGFAVIAWAVLTLGWRPAVLTAIVAYVGGNYLFVQPEGPVLWTRPQDILALLTFGLSAGLIIFIGHRARRAERQLAKANQELREADRKKDEFLATLSHELRNPISVITTAVSVLEAGDNDPRQRSTIEVLSRQAAQIRRLVDDLLDVGRITRGRLALRTASVDLRICVEQAAEGNDHAVSRKRQQLQLQLPQTPIEVDIDHARMVQVISNLIDNASKYSPEQAELRVVVVDGDVVSIDVTDTGPGIDAAVLPHVFDIYAQGGASGSEGLGLGLGLCKRIVEMHGGTIEAASNPQGQGACFRIRLPKLVTAGANPEPHMRPASPRN